MLRLSLILMLTISFLTANDLNHLRKATDFKLLLPTDSSLKQNKIEIKEPYSIELDPPIPRVRIHYFDASGQNYEFGLEEHKAAGYKVRRIKTIMDARTKTSKTEINEENFKFDLRGEKVYINGIEGRFEAWVNHDKGGYLRWIQDDTYLEMDSGVLTKQMMLDIAASLQ
ncbi:hypothetical protein BK138_13965 [Paenibacillus rhizosphaerae]|uniref:DUF4367 domain-containing protein n=1 Tax=Paenibacillus rhizosphaerae TaxID=297318 RepID=A0A1R1ER28_9BACL|nr:hypothetical protein [Paenibacillus rhizosphaerae]OMF54296.1 hypothetical protein BK138_13965 [Paenibacillus rhizosphaerae]